MTKVCRNCQTENPIDGVFCTECGMSLRRAPTKEESEARLGRTWKDRTQPELPLTASGLLYLFGEQFVEPGSGRFLGGQTLLVYSGHKVATERLAHRLLLVALVSLAEEGYISLREEKRLSWTLFPPELYLNVAIISREKEGDDLPRSLEREIMNALSGDPEENRVPAVVARVITGEGYVTPAAPGLAGRGMVIYFWKWVVDCVMWGLAEAGYLDWAPKAGLIDRGYTARWWADQEAVAPLAGEVETLKNTLEALRRANPRLYGSLVDEVRVAWGGTPE